MKLSCSRDELFATLSTVARVASTRSAIQALSGVQLQAADGAAELRGTDMEVSLRVPLAAEIEQDGVDRPAGAAAARRRPRAPG